MSEVELHLGDCLEILPSLKDSSINAIIADLPYGTTACSWDSIIPLDLMWDQLDRLVKSNAPIILFGSQPFTSKLVMSRPNLFKYELVYEKTNAKGFLSAKTRPLTAHENILIFAFGKSIFNPQKWKVPDYLITRRKHATSKTAEQWELDWRIDFDDKTKI